MKKLIAVFSVFIFALTLGVGISIVVVEDVQACICVPLYEELIPSCDTGPLCTNPNYPYYMYQTGMCGANPCTPFSSCYNGIRGGCL